MEIKVKICATKNSCQAQNIIESKADIIGLLVGQKHTSDDFITKEEAKEIVKFVDNRCDTSLVTHLLDSKTIIELTNYIGNNIIQLHSNIEETEVEIIRRALPLVKLVRLIHVDVNGQIITNYKKMKNADFYLLDSFNLATGQVGGTGLTYDWVQVKGIVKKLDKPTFIAGGLNPNNVKEAIDIIKPYGVDVNSGCKNELGQKDNKKVLEFVKNAKNI
ncbi:MAG: phosphoribosylanthranilate isomerase [Mycoplasmatota bacterium]